MIEFIKNKKKTTISCVVGTVLLVAMGYWTLYARFIESTDNAYVKNPLIAIAPKVEGYIQQIPITDGTRVKKGDVLLRIEPKEYEENVRALKSKLDQIDLNLKQLDIQYQLAKLEIDTHTQGIEKAQAELDQSKKSFQRSKKLVQDQFTSQESFEDKKTNLIRGKATLEQIKIQLHLAKLKHNEKDLERQKVEKQRDETLAQLAIAQLRLDHTIIRAPRDGFIAGTLPQVGEFFRPGMIAMYVSNLDDLWIMANFKETQLKDMRVGQKARIEVDAFSSQTFFGTVASISPVSGAELALLPPDNATGNFTKVVQRIPVKIIFDPQKAPKMIPGMSVHIDINTKKSA
jgi:membrane fusion protein (multidrug efflux system)